MPGFYLAHIKITSFEVLSKLSLPICAVSICCIVWDDSIIKINHEEKRMGVWYDKNESQKYVLVSQIHVSFLSMQMYVC
jgi:hypothetical protein